MTQTMAAAEARGKFPGILDAAEKGRTTVILRHSRPSAAVIPASELPAFNLFRRIMREVGETLDVSRNPEMIAAVQRSQDEVDRGQVFWDEEA
jgi:prevent-host-death family protein